MKSDDNNHKKNINNNVPEIQNSGFRIQKLLPWNTYIMWQFQPEECASLCFPYKCNKDTF